MTRTINLLILLIAASVVSLAACSCKAPEKEEHDPNAGFMVDTGGIQTGGDEEDEAAEGKRAGVLTADPKDQKTWGTTGSITWRSKIGQAWDQAFRNDLNVLVFFYDPTSKECRDIDSTFKNSKDLIDLSTYFYCVKLDVNKPSNADDVKYFRGKPAPQLVVYNPGKAQLWRSQSDGQDWSEEALLKRLKLYRRRTEKRKGT